jgi:hypothetical protein
MRFSSQQHCIPNLAPKVKKKVEKVKKGRRDSIEEQRTHVAHDFWIIPALD